MNATSQIMLGVNIDHVATLRQQRGTRYPEPLQAALVAEQAGADAITMHLREDRRHIQDRDVELVSQLLQTRLNLEMAATPEMQVIAMRVQPADCCLVPERREELTTEGGLNVVAAEAHLRDYCAVLADADIRVSLFVDPDPRQLDAARSVGAPVVEIHTGAYADASDAALRQLELTKIQRAVDYGNSLGLQVNAGHGLDYYNTAAVAAIPGIREFNIGHSIVSRAVFAGLAGAVREMKALLRGG